MTDSPSDERELRSRPATTPQEQENRLISLAVRQAESQLEAGNAPTQVVSYLLKLATTREQAELEKLALETELVKAKTRHIDGEAEQRKMVEKAMTAFKEYAGYEGEDITLD